MRITQLTRALNLFLLVRLLQFLVSPAAAAATPMQQRRPQLLHSRSHAHQKRLTNSMAQMDETCDTPGGRNPDPGRDTGTDMQSAKAGAKCDIGVGRTNAKLSATNIAQKAASDAEQAYGTQQSAAAEVAHMVKQQLADRANAAAKAAEAALSGKQQVVEQLEAEIVEAESVLRQELECIASAQTNLNSAKMSASKAEEVMTAMQHGLKIAEENLSHAKATAAGAQQDYDEKTQLADVARKRIEMLKKQHLEYCNELQKIKKSAYKAFSAAAEARKKARERRTARSRRRRKRQHHQQEQQEQHDQLQQ
ncbi:uncharacterized protein LOC6574600 [Drosophila mojavensis]|uniref:Uncharacterized protein n=1 Tax=Drosophila mojavensis TaxID=7230 RepID=B4K4U5_DROMO|nr:uncharacterized protein LOC6574600 [Drosophila mojavensis]EDW16098.1 uncharacterized protein Dmoj_GI10341 [Drosophila mojavensis]